MIYAKNQQQKLLRPNRRITKYKILNALITFSLRQLTNKSGRLSGEKTLENPSTQRGDTNAKLS